MADVLSAALPRCCRDRRGKAKVAYRTEALAAASASGSMRPYWCSHCGNYHNGHKPRPVFYRRRWARAAVRAALGSGRG